MNDDAEYTVRWQPDCDAGDDGYEYLTWSHGCPHIFGSADEAMHWLDSEDPTAEVVCRIAPQWQPVAHHSSQEGG